MINKKISYKKKLSKIKKATLQFMIEDSTPFSMFPKLSNEPALSYLIHEKEDDTKSVYLKEESGETQRNNL